MHTCANGDTIVLVRNSADASPFRSASIKDIARLAKVSHSTVSRALHHSPLVNPETGDKIRRIAEETGYRRSAVARSLVTRRTDTVGVVVTHIADPFAAEVVGGIEDAALERGFSVILANSGGDPDQEVRAVESLEERRVDGIVVTSSRVGALYVPMLARMKVPIVLLNNQHPGDFVHSVMIDNVEASIAVTRHLIEAGHRRIAYIGDRNGHQSDTERFEGYLTALANADLMFDAGLVAQGDGKPTGAPAAVERVMAQPQPPTAIFCYNDMTALGVMREVRARGLKIPDDISVVGFDDIPFAEYVDPPLTTIRQPMHEMGRLAMRTLFGLLAGSDSTQNIKVPGELIVRRSTAAPKETR